MATFLVILVSLSGLGAYYFNPKFQREDWREAVQFVESQDPQKSVALFEFSDSFASYEWYSQEKIRTFGVLPGLLATPELVGKQLLKATEGTEKVFLFQYLQPLTDPQELVSSWLGNNNYVLTEIKDFSGVGFVFVYNKRR